MRHVLPYRLFENSESSGLTKEQENWLNKSRKVLSKWEYNPETGLVDIDGSFDCSEQELTDFKGVKFGKVTGFFDCSFNKLTSLEGAPHTVGSTFRCSGNNLSSLDGCPEEVGETFSCSYNNLTSLAGCPKEIGGSFQCSDNRLASLEGGPKIIGEDFNCSRNELTSLIGSPEIKKSSRPKSSFNCSNNMITSLEGAPTSGIGRDFYDQKYKFICKGNPVQETTLHRIYTVMADKNISFSEALKLCWKERFSRPMVGVYDSVPDEDKAILAVYHPDLTQDDLRMYKALATYKKKDIII
jgi:hypothetical protein